MGYRPIRDLRGRPGLGANCRRRTSHPNTCAVANSYDHCGHDNCLDNGNSKPHAHPCSHTLAYADAGAHADSTTDRNNARPDTIGHSHRQPGSDFYTPTHTDLYPDGYPHPHAYHYGHDSL